MAAVSWQRTVCVGCGALDASSAGRVNWKLSPFWQWAGTVTASTPMSPWQSTFITCPGPTTATAV